MFLIKKICAIQLLKAVEFCFKLCFFFLSVSGLHFFLVCFVKTIHTQQRNKLLFSLNNHSYCSVLIRGIKMTRSGFYTNRNHLTTDKHNQALCQQRRGAAIQTVYTLPHFKQWLTAGISCQNTRVLEKGKYRMFFKCHPIARSRVCQI